MSDTLLTFDFSDTPVRVLLLDEQPWFVATDVCRVLEHSNASMALLALDADDLSNAEVIDSLGRKQTANVVNESGLYSLIFASRKEKAREFKRWVTRDVLPSIRQTGRYEMAGATAEDAAERDMREIVELAVRGLWAGSLPVAKATAIFTGAKLHWLMGHAERETELPESEPQAVLLPGDQGEFGRLVAWMAAQSERKEWTPAELRLQAVEMGLFEGWLKFSEVDSPRTMGRFGKVCEAAVDRVFAGYVFGCRGKNRHRRYLVTRVRASVPAGNIAPATL